MFDIQINSPFGEVKFAPLSLKTIVYSRLPHRNEDCSVILSHLGNELITISLKNLRVITNALSERLSLMGLKRGDTILLASFSSTNELANALIFTAAVCEGIRVFVPIFPEPSEFRSWKDKTGFKCLIMPYREILLKKGHEREKEVVETLRSKCINESIPFLDSFTDFSAEEIIRQALSGQKKSFTPLKSVVSPEDEAVIFTTSGTSGKSKLLAYTHQSFATCCQAWQLSGLFSKDLFGNPGFSPLFTHTIGIRTFLNSIWSGNPFCIIVTDWFLTRPEVARYFLINMKPGHLISGPAFYNTMLELFRQYPELKLSVSQSLRAAISIGAPYDQTTAARFRSATGIAMMNGLGTTETLMVTLNRDEGSGNYMPACLGSLLPGVSLGLNKTEEQGIYELFIKSAFQSVRTIGEERQNGFFDTGDLVRYDEDSGKLWFLGRRSSDFIKDEYGVKIPVNALQSYYHEIFDIAEWIEWVPLINIPGLAALIFVRNDYNHPLKDIAPIVKSINEGLKRGLEPFEYSHRHLERISIVEDDVPLTRKGTVSKDQILKKYDQCISDLRNPFVDSHQIEVTEPGDKSDLFKFTNPHMAELLEALRLDKIYFRGEGDYLYYNDGETVRKVTDYVGGFGANLIGHNNIIIRETIEHFLSSGYPALNNQGSQYYYPSLLARELNRLFGRSTGKYFRVQFGNSGTEATEIAIHHAYYEWRLKIEKLRDEQLQLFGSDPSLSAAEIWDNNMIKLDSASPSIIVVKTAFHGYSTGARSLLGPKKQRQLFSGLLRLKPLYVDDKEDNQESQVKELTGINHIELNVIQTLDGHSRPEPLNFCTVIASIIEPVRGEGGICEVNPDLVDILAGQDFPLISDEIQCGLGRSGSLPSCKKASYYLLGKSLGGGIEKISAVLIDDRRFKPTFTKYFSSTFANGELAACCGLATLRIIEQESLAELASVKGRAFLASLRNVSEKFPDIIDSVSGAGLMTGINFCPSIGRENIIFRMLFENEMMGYLFAGWALNNHNIRVLPSLSKPNSVRIEPSFYIEEKETGIFCSVLDEFCRKCRGKELYEIFKFLMNGDPYPDRANPLFEGSFPQVIEEPATGSIRAGFIGNFTLPHRELQVIEPDFMKASDTGLRILFNRLQILFEGKPIRILSRNLMNGKVHFTFYILPADTYRMEVVNRWGKKRFLISKIQEAADKLSAEGVTCLSLGAHTSIITGNGLNIAERQNSRVLTGNTLTVATCLYYLKRHLRSVAPGNKQRLNIAVVGAGGNVGAGLTGCLDEPEFLAHNIILIGNNGKRLIKLREKLTSLNNSVVCSTDLFDLKEADAIICCVNTNDPIIFPHHLSDTKPVFIIDISVPSAISQRVFDMHNIVFCKDASSVFLKDDKSLLISSHTPAGKVFCCAGESILCALYNPDVPLKGHIRKESVCQMMELAINNMFYEK